MANAMRRAVPGERTFILADARAADISAAALKAALEAAEAPAGGAADDVQVQAAVQELARLQEEYGVTLAAEDSAAGRSGEVPASPNPRIDAFVQAVFTGDSAEFHRQVAAGKILPEEDSLRLIKWSTPDAEIAGQAAWAAELLEADASLRPADVFIVVPNRAWASGFSRALAARRLGSSIALSDDLLRGDARDGAKCTMLQAFARVHLLADGDDVMAWRIWCGIGSADLGAAAWARLRKSAADRGISLMEALHRLADEVPAGCEVLAARVAEGRAFAEPRRGLTGYSLFHACGPDCHEALERLAGEEAATATAPAFAQVFRSDVLDQPFDGDPVHVRIGDLAKLVRLEGVPVVIVAGAVEGILPHVEGEEERRLFAAAASRATRTLVISHFQKAPEAWAKAMRLTGVRRKVETGENFVVFRRSRFMDDAGDAAPTAESGEQSI